MRKIAVVTGSRSEYGLLRNILFKINESSKLELELIVTGSHLAPNHGYTVNEIYQDCLHIADQLPIHSNLEDSSAISREMGLLMIELSKTFSRIKPDILLILGDRYEIFAAASVAMVMNIPIAHISGGEVTEGAIDDQIRHAITKMAHLHFPGNELYANNIVQMGEESWRVFNFGDVGIENITKIKFKTKEEIKENLNIEVSEDSLLITYHPVTQELQDLEKQVDNLISALKVINRQMIITYPNSDCGNEVIIRKMISFRDENTNVHLFDNLGIINYLSIMKLCGVVVGNSSSGIVEAPYLKIPVVNIGNRQKGRLMANNVISCGYTTSEIIESLNVALSESFKSKTQKTISLYGEGNTSEKIVDIIENIEINEKLLIKKLGWR